MNVVMRKLGCVIWIVCVAIAYSEFAYAAESRVTVQAAGVTNKSCPQVNCDCNEIPEGKWRNICLSRETSIIGECVLNAGKPKSYCGLHGPAAYPVATSVQFKDRPKFDPEVNPASILPMVETQTWSLLDDFKVFKSKIDVKDLDDAIAVFGIFRTNGQKLFDLQQLVLFGFNAQKSIVSTQRYSDEFAKSSRDIALNLSALGDVLWDRALKANDPKLKKDYRLLAFKVSREAATVLERTAELYIAPKNYLESANYWQKASAETRKLLNWEEKSGNKPKFVAFYQQQISARLNRATLYWLLAGANEKVTTNIEQVRDGFSADEDKILIGEANKKLQVSQEK